MYFLFGGHTQSVQGLLLAQGPLLAGVCGSYEVLRIKTGLAVSKTSCTIFVPLVYSIFKQMIPRKSPCNHKYTYLLGRNHLLSRKLKFLAIFLLYKDWT